MDAKLWHAEHVMMMIKFLGLGRILTSGSRVRPARKSRRRRASPETAPEEERGEPPELGGAGSGRRRPGSGRGRPPELGGRRPEAGTRRRGTKGGGAARRWRAAGRRGAGLERAPGR